MNTSPYVFISYAHRDSHIVLPCIEALRQNGINVWYDNGIEAGSEWPEFIAEKVVTCTKFVLFVSKAYLESQNCKRELNFAISRKRNILTIFIEDVMLSPGMEMQLGTYQAVYKNRFLTAASFHESLSAEQFFDECRKNSSYTRPKTGTSTQGTNTFAGTSSRTYTSNTSSYNRSNTSSYNNTHTQNTEPIHVPVVNTSVTPAKNRIVAALLAIFLGTFGAHKFYCNQIKLGLIYAVFFWTYIPYVIGFLEGLELLFANQQKLEKKYNCRFE